MSEARSYRMSAIAGIAARLLVVALLATGIVALVAVPALATGRVWSTQRISKTGDDAQSVKMSGSLMAWRGANNSLLSIYLHDLRTGQQRVLSVGPGYREVITLSAECVGWDEDASGGFMNNWDYVLYSVASGTRRRVSLGNADVWAGDGARVVWVDRREGDYVLHAYDFDSQLESKVATVGSAIGGTAPLPALSGDTVIWAERTGDAYELMSADLATHTQRRLPLTIPAHFTGPNAEMWWNFSPILSNNRLFWLDDRNRVAGSDERNCDLYSFDLASNVETRVTSVPAPISGFSVDGDSVALTEHKGAGNFDSNSNLYLLDLATGARQLVASTNQGPIRSTAVSGGRVAWTGPRSQTVYTDHDYTYLSSLKFKGALSKPAVSSKAPRRGKRVTFTTRTNPEAASTGAKVTLVLSHWEIKTVRKKIRGKWRNVRVSYWHERARLKTTATRGSVAYSVRTKFTRKGRWKAQAVSSETGDCTAASSSVRAFTVR